MPVPHTATVGMRAVSAPRCAQESMPRAMPLIISKCRTAKSRASISATPEPYGEGCRVPTIAIPGLLSSLAGPRTHSTGGGS
jgi:hypothetical protein